ncbi:TetR/AcrR family transcriptional regulator [Lysobacter korlensis]|uniref:TetR/AcrR family transcriptional regulator n=1 Tax=Lysobacter korlensis TaxID=553636 RepID=A0ABV6S116_9GAMM
MKTIRPYTQRARAEASEATHLRIMDALVRLVAERSSMSIQLTEVAERAGVSVQTILRRFGSRDGLFDQTLAHESAKVEAEREAPAGNPPEALRILIDHYEQRGDGMMALLSQESADERARSIVTTGRAVHRRWVESVFAPWLGSGGTAERSERVRLLIAATDLYVWKLLRRDMGLSRQDTEAHMLRLLEGLLESFPRQ